MSIPKDSGLSQTLARLPETFVSCVILRVSLPTASGMRNEPTLSQLPALALEWPRLRIARNIKMWGVAGSGIHLVIGVCQDVKWS